MYVEALPADSKSPVVLLGTPGTALFSTLPTFPVYGLHVMNGILYAVTATKIYSIANTGAYTEIGDIAISGRVSMADNGTQLVFVDGSVGYYYTVSDGVTQLSGDGWYPANSVAYQDGYFIFNRAGTGEFFISELLGIGLDPIDYATAEGAPDDTLAILSDHRELWQFGEQSTEVWYNSGDADFPFERMQGAFIESGISAPKSAVKIDNSVIWLDDNGVINRAAGYQPIRISTHDVERSLELYDVSDAYAYTYTDEGHPFYVLTVPKSVHNHGITWCFDVSSGLWHERESYIHGAHNANCYAKAYGIHIVGDYQNGMVYQLDKKTYSDNGDSIIRRAISPALSFGRNRATIHSLEIDMETGIGLADGQGDDPQSMLRWSDDGCKTWSNEHWSAIGKIGNYLTRVKWNRLGSMRQRQFELVISDPVPVAIYSAVIEVENGSN